MLNSDLPHRNPFIGPPVAVAVELPIGVVERFADALHEWARSEPSRADGFGEGV